MIPVGRLAQLALRAVLALVLWASTVAAAPIRLGHQLTAGAQVEGSVKHGGLQPDYAIDLGDAEWDRLFRYADRVAQHGGDPWSQADAIARYVRTRVLRDRSYAGADYRALMTRYRRLGQSVPLVEYVKIAAGVCREHAMITHLLLERAGLRSRYLYVQADQAGHVEDHAVVLVERRGEAWVVDSYNPHFHGRRLADLRRAAGVRPTDAVAAGATRVPLELGRFRFTKLHRFPLVTRGARAITARSH